ncbi:MAG TPA: methyltransferase domain-containing protein [Gemmatimonas sp.]|nr:methyltransferase domain-containing protein [Gemmatimonas sp.]
MHKLLLVAVTAAGAACAGSNDVANVARSNSARPAVNGSTGSSASMVQDTVGPAAPAGEPASSFPAPSRPVASIVAPRWTNEDDRDDAGEFARVAGIAKVGRGVSVADIGAGDGYYVVRLAGIVGPTGVVYGEDIVPDYLRLLQERVRREGLTNVRLSKGDAHDPRLPAGDVEVAIMIHMYHEIDQPFGLLYNLAPAMRAGGRVVILDLDRPTFGHGTPPSLLRCELKAVGYRELSFTKTGPEEYVAVFEAPVTAARPSPANIRAALTAKPCRAPA